MIHMQSCVFLKDEKYKTVNAYLFNYDNGGD